MSRLPRLRGVAARALSPVALTGRATIPSGFAAREFWPERPPWIHSVHGLRPPATRYQYLTLCKYLMLCGTAIAFYDAVRYSCLR